MDLNEDDDPLTRDNTTICSIEEAHRLYDRVRKELLVIKDWSGKDVSVKTSDKVGTLIKGALDSPRYIPIRMDSLTE